MTEETEQPNGKTILSEEWVVNNNRSKYSPKTIERLLHLYVEGKSFKDLGKELNIPVSTFYEWGRREKQKGTELGKLLCSRKPKAPLRVEFPGGSVYNEGENGKAVIEEDHPPKSAQVSSGIEETFVDEILEELALRLGRKEIEIVTLKFKLSRKG